MAFTGVNGLQLVETKNVNSEIAVSDGKTVYIRIESRRHDFPVVQRFLIDEFGGRIGLPYFEVARSINGRQALSIRCRTQCNYRLIKRINDPRDLATARI